MTLTSLPMQRCCIPTRFSHLWWRLILQALQRRPCFAVLPARNTTCLAVVPETHRKKKESRFAFTSGAGLESTRVLKKKKKGGGTGKYCSELHRPWNSLANVTQDTHFCKAVSTRPTLTEPLPIRETSSNFCRCAPPLDCL